MMSFFTELKRRNVFKVGAAYAIVAWLLIQITVTVLPTFDAPRWVQQTITFVILLGFPLALFFAWAFELTPEGIKATTPEGPAQYHTRTTGHRLNYFIISVLVLAVTFILVDNYVLVDRPRATVASITGTSATTPVAKDASTVKTAPSPPSPVTDAPVLRSLIDLGQTQAFPAANLDTFIALSRDGRQLVYVKRKDGINQLYYRAMDQLAARPIPGTEGAFDAFFSPDGKWIAYESTNDLYKVAITGNTPHKLAEKIVLPRGVFWSDDDVIYYNYNGKLQRVSANGGTPEPVTLQSKYASWYHAWPCGLPGGTHLLLTVHQGLINARDGDILLLNLKTGQTQTLIRNGFNARYVPTGHLVFMRAGSLWAVPFDVKQLKTTGPEVPVVNGVETAGGLGQAVYAFSDAGFLIYLPGKDMQGADSSVVQNSRLVWVDRAGKETPVGAKPDRYQTVRLSPDGRQVALSVGNMASGMDIWTYDLERGILSRRTFIGDAGIPLWSPDGSRFAYTFLPQFHGLAWVRADGAGQPETLIDAPRALFPLAFTADGSQLVYGEGVTGPNDLYTLSMKGEQIEKSLLATKFNETAAALSPDGRWLAYVSNETGREEIFVRPFPRVEDGKWQVSNNGGLDPRWRGDGKELFYRQGENPLAMMAVPIETGEEFRAGTPLELFRGDYYRALINLSLFDVTPDGQRFLMLKAVEETGEEQEATVRQTSLVLVDNWFEELKRLAPPAN